MIKGKIENSVSRFSLIILRCPTGSTVGLAKLLGYFDPRRTKPWLNHGFTDKVCCPAGDSLKRHPLEDPKSRTNVDRRMRGVAAITLPHRTRAR